MDRRQWHAILDRCVASCRQVWDAKSADEAEAEIKEARQAFDEAYEAGLPAPATERERWADEDRMKSVAEELGLARDLAANMRRRANQTPAQRRAMTAFRRALKAYRPGAPDALGKVLYTMVGALEAHKS